MSNASLPSSAAIVGVAVGPVEGPDPLVFAASDDQLYRRTPPTKEEKDAGVTTSQWLPLLETPQPSFLPGLLRWVRWGGVPSLVAARSDGVKVYPLVPGAKWAVGVDLVPGRAVGIAQSDQVLYIALATGGLWTAQLGGGVSARPVADLPPLSAVAASPERVVVASSLGLFGADAGPAPQFAAFVDPAPGRYRAVGVLCALDKTRFLAARSPAQFDVNDWPHARLRGASLWLEKAIDTLEAGGWAALLPTPPAKPPPPPLQPPVPRVWRVQRVERLSVSAFGKSQAVSQLTLENAQLDPVDPARELPYQVRDAVVLAGSSPLPLLPLGLDLRDLYKGGELPLRDPVPPLPSGRQLMVGGRLLRAKPRDKVWFVTPAGVPLPDVKPVSPPKVLFAVRYLRGDGSPPPTGAPADAPPPAGWLLRDPVGCHYLARGGPQQLPLDLPDKEDPEVFERLTVDPGDTAPVGQPLAATLATLQLPLIAQWVYTPTVVVLANVVAATEGQVVRGRVLGSGDGSKANQSFVIGRATVLSTGEPACPQSSLIVQVDGLTWKRVGSLATQGPHDRSYATSLTREGETQLNFGDGRHGARLPSGSNNVLVSYRAGAGALGNVGEGALTLVAEGPSFVDGATNPLPASGGRSLPPASTLAATSGAGLSGGQALISLGDYRRVVTTLPGVVASQVAQVFLGGRKGVGVTVAPVKRPQRADATKLLQSVREALESRRSPQLRRQLPLAVGLACERGFVVHAQLGLKRGRNAQVVAQAAARGLRTAFGYACLQPGESLASSRVVEVLLETAGVSAARLVALDALPAPGGQPGRLSLVPAGPAAPGALAAPPIVLGPPDFQPAAMLVLAGDPLLQAGS